MRFNLTALGLALTLTQPLAAQGRYAQSLGGIWSTPIVTDHIFNDIDLQPALAPVVTLNGSWPVSKKARLGAEAAIRALESFTEGTITFDLVGVKVVRAFDANVVIASLIQRGDSGPDRLLGCYLADGDMVRGAALAVLNATNRVLGNYISTR